MWTKDLYDENIPPPSNDLIVSYSGLGSLTSNETAAWTSSVSNDTMPYTYKWYVDGVLQQTHQGSSENSFTWTAGYSNFTLKLSVTDNTGETDAQETTIIVTDCSSVQTNNPQPCN